ncbi:MAG: hypothetical protein JW889_05230 [Verrucomicrobia bacterium]|nr:hypothetical protein [Verrucomicrobiota bacterium]
MLDSGEQRKEQERAVPKALVDDLAALHEAGLAVPPEVDRAILAVARQHIAANPALAGRRQFLLLRRWAPVGAMAAVAVLLTLLLLPARLHKARQRAALRSPAAVQIEREDIDRSGEVDILDAFALARHIESGAMPGKDWDINGDGVVDGEDVNQIALAAVSLERSTLQ